MTAPDPYRTASRSPTAICTWSGQTFDFDWSVEQMARAVRIEDVAHALARLGRYTGHTADLRSVGLHSLEVADAVAATVTDLPPRIAALWELHALLHDAPEAYVGDMAAPLKHALGASSSYRAIHDRVDEAIRFRLMLPRPSTHMERVIRQADLDNREDGLERFRMSDLSIDDVERAFLDRFNRLMAAWRAP